MKKFFLMVCISFILMQISSYPVCASVATSTARSVGDDVVTIAGNPGFYPVEYFNEKTRQFEGIIPDIMADISQKIGIDFVYIHDGKTSQDEYANSLRAELVTSYIIGSKQAFAASEFPLLPLKYEDREVNIGVAFTEAADSVDIKRIKSELAKITVEEMNMYIIGSNSETRTVSTRFKTGALIVSSVLLILLILLFFKYRIMRKKIIDNKFSDTETGIGNIEYFEKQYEKMLSAQGDNKYIAYIVIDSNYLQIYHGEAVFIDSIKYTAGVLREYETENGFVARITENGFVYVFESKDFGEANEIIQSITNELNLYINAETKYDMSFFHTALYNITADDRNGQLVLFNLRKHCNQLMGSANQLVVVDSEMMNSALAEKELYESIVKGFDNKEFKLYIQFIVDRENKKIVSAEALSRWENPETGIVPPVKYITLMEKSGLITKFDYYMFGMACRQLHKWRGTEFENLTLSCNFTRITISEENFADMISSIAERYVFKKNKLIMEITEDAIEKNRDVAMKNILKCKKMGFRVALDDLGSGYTSLVNLCEYPIDIVKIDRDILLRVEKENGKDLFKGIIALSHSLGFKVVCEGVETEAHRELVDSTECDYIQGWYYSKVHPIAEAEQYAREYSA